MKLVARIYSGRKGRHGSKKPPVKTIQRWVKLKKNEVENLVIKLAEQKYSSSIIGIILRDQYGIPDVKTITGKSITQIMKDKKLYPELPEDMLSLLRKAVRLREHLEANKADKHSKKGLENLESKIRRLGKYYTRTGMLPKNWKYDPNEAKLIIQK